MKSIAFFTRVYNGEKYIQKCVESILNQTYRNFEYYIVDNGSKDNTWDILNQFAVRDNRIHLFRLETNTNGLLEKYIPVIEKNNHEYFATLDADDWFEPLFAEVLIDFSEKNNLDIAACGTCFHFVSTNETGYRKPHTDLVITKNEIPDNFSYIYKFFRTTWGKLFKMSVIKKVNHSEVCKVLNGYGADTVVCLEALSASCIIGLSGQVLHNYSVRGQSVSYEYNPNRIASDIFLFRKGEEFLKSFGKISPQNYLFLYSVYINAIIDTLSVVLSSTLDDEGKLDETETILREKLTQNVLEIDMIFENQRFSEFRDAFMDWLMRIQSANPQNKEILYKIYRIICLLNKNISPYITIVQLPKHLKYRKFLLQAIKTNGKAEMLKQAISFLDDPVVSGDLWAAVKEQFKDRILLSRIESPGFVAEYQDIIADVYSGDLEKAEERLIALISGNNALAYREAFLTLCSNVSAARENGALFVLSKKLTTQLYIESERYGEAKAVLQDLLDMCPEDGEVIGLRDWLREKNG